jgi:NitT/TauT family transport system substrate-binding protein
MNSTHATAALSKTFSRTIALGLFFSLALGSIACAPPPPNAAPTPNGPSTAAKKSGTIRFALITAVSAAGMPVEMALAQLRQEGYDVQETVFPDGNVEADALARGDMDMGGGNPVTLWPAIVKGARVRTIASQYENPFSIVAANDIKECKDLQGKNFASGSPSGFNAVLVNLYIQENCPGTSPNYLVISDSAARMAALLAGQADATPLEIADILQANKQAPGKYHSLVDFAKAYKKIEFATVAVNQDFAAKHREMVQDMLASLVTTYRAIKANPQLIYDAMAQTLKMTPEDAKTTSDAYLAAGVWDVNGGMTNDSVQATINFFAKQKKLPATIKPEDVADLSFLNTVLKELGQQ